MGKLKNIAVALFMIVFLASLFMNVVHFASRQQKTRDTTRTTYVDTIPFYKPIPKERREEVYPRLLQCDRHYGRHGRPLG